MNELPPLPEPDAGNKIRGYLYAEQKMLTYGRACEKAAYERAARACEQEAAKYRYDKTDLRDPKRLRSDSEVVADNCAAAIRVLGVDK